jgi:flagellar motor switch/type III secretory pathway protein FliN
VSTNPHPAPPDSAIEAALAAAARAVTVANLEPGPLVTGGAGTDHPRPADEPVVVTLTVSGALDGTVMLAAGAGLVRRLEEAGTAAGAADVLAPVAEAVREALGAAGALEATPLVEVPGDAWPGDAPVVSGGGLREGGETVLALAFALTAGSAAAGGGDEATGGDDDPDAEREAGAGARASDPDAEREAGGDDTRADPVDVNAGPDPDTATDTGPDPDTDAADPGADAGADDGDDATAVAAHAVSAPGTSSLSTSDTASANPEPAPPSGLPAPVEGGTATTAPGRPARPERSTPTLTGDAARLGAIEVEVSGVLGETVVALHDLLSWLPGVIVPLHRSVGMPVDLRIDTATVAHAEVVVVDEHYALRVTDVVTGAAARARAALGRPPPRPSGNSSL